MKYYKVKFMRSSGIGTYYAYSKDKNIQIKLDHNRELLITERQVKDIMEIFDVYYIEYVGTTVE